MNKPRIDWDPKEKAGDLFYSGSWVYHFFRSVREQNKDVFDVCVIIAMTFTVHLLFKPPREQTDEK